MFDFDVFVLVGIKRRFFEISADVDSNVFIGVARRDDDRTPVVERIVESASSVDSLPPCALLRAREAGRDLDREFTGEPERTVCGRGTASVAR